MSHKIAVEVVYALPEKQYLQRVTLEEGATVEAAIRASGILELRSDIDLAKNKVGIYSRPVKLGDAERGRPGGDLSSADCRPERAASSARGEGQQVALSSPMALRLPGLRFFVRTQIQKRCSMSTFLHF